MGSRDIAFNLDAPGTFVYAGPVATRGARLNRFCLSLKGPENRDDFAADPRGYMAGFGLAGEEMALVEARDWTGLLKAGGHLQAILKLAACVGEDLWSIAAHNTGMTRTRSSRPARATRPACRSRGGAPDGQGGRRHGHLPHAVDGPGVRHRHGAGVRPPLAAVVRRHPPREGVARQARPDHVVVFYNDHLNHFTFDAYPTLAIGVSDTFRQADEGWGLRPFPDVSGDTDFAWGLTEKLVRAGFDLTVCQELSLDHGVYSWLPYVADAPWPWKVTPIAANLIRHPIPTNERSRALGAATRAAIDAWPGDERVLVIASGGMSHQISGARFGIANEGLDRWFIAELERNMAALIATPQVDYMRYGGVEAAELAIWFAMRAALSDDIRRAYDYHTVPQITGCGVVAFEERSST